MQAEAVAEVVLEVALLVVAVVPQIILVRRILVVAVVLQQVRSLADMQVARV
jgi:hypothetical protein